MNGCCCLFCFVWGEIWWASLRWQLPDGVRTNGVFAEVAQVPIMYVHICLEKVDTWTDRPFKGFTANAQCYLNALQTNFNSRATWPTGPKFGTTWIHHVGRAGKRAGKDFWGFDSSRILILRGWIPRPIGDVPESVSQRILIGIILVGRLGVHAYEPWCPCLCSDV